MAVSGQALAGTNRQVERAVGTDDVSAVGSQQRVIRTLVHRIGKTGRRDSVGNAVRVYAEFLAPGIGRLEIEAGDIPQRLQHLHGVVIGVSEIGEKRRVPRGATDRTAELRIGQDEILREIVSPEHRTVDAGRHRRQTLIARAGECDVIQLGYLSRQCRVVSVGEVAPQHRVVSQLQCARLTNAVECRADRPKIPCVADDVNAVEHLIQQC